LLGVALGIMKAKQLPKNEENNPFLNPRFSGEKIYEV
jgi:hypothetical protein